MSPKWKENEVSPFFNGWKEIAQYLGKGVRTVQRYEAQQGLPVHRSSGGSRGSVIATKAELDAWVSASPLRGRYSQQFIRTQTLFTTPKEFVGGIKQMAMLRSDMMQLRSDLKSSLTLLTERIRVVSDVLVKDRAKVADGQSIRGMAGDLDTLLENAIPPGKFGTLRKQ